MRRILATAVAIVGLCAGDPTQTIAAGHLRAMPPQASPPALGDVHVRDRVIHPGRRALASADIYGGDYTTAAGSVVSVYESSAYVPDDSVLQSWADFIGSLVHGGEIRHVVIFLSPYDEMQALCGSVEADSCYDADNEIIYVVGDTPPDGTPLEDLAAHEYGHHVANSRSNAPWPAVDYGPKYWATRMHVCENAGYTMFPGAEGRNYALNPGEGWAETYRVLNDLDVDAWPIVDDLFYPGWRELRAARRDVLQPWAGLEYTDYRGRMGSRHRWRMIPLTVQNDGRVQIDLRGSGTLDADLYLYKSRYARRPLHKATHSGRREHLSGIYCGYRRLWLGVYRYRGSGSYRLRVSLPWTTEY